MKIQFAFYIVRRGYWICNVFFGLIYYT